MSSFQYGQINLNALLVPGLYVVVDPPGSTAINGLPTNLLAVVGTGTWGPVNSPTVFGSPQEGAALFGQTTNRKYDLITQVCTAALQGANYFKGVRVTDGTDTSASVEILTNCLAITSIYSGSDGSGIQVNIAPGSLMNSWRVTVFMPGLASESFDNIGATVTGNALWQAIASAINNGTNVQRGPSHIIVASAGAGTAVPQSATYNLTGGSDGATTITGATLIGSDTANPRTGMYALRNSQASVCVLADCDDSTTWSTQSAFGIQENIYMIGVSPSADSIANAISTLQNAGIDSFQYKHMFGDWVYWNDPGNGSRVVSPQGFVAGQLATAAPNQPALNQLLYGIDGTQKSKNFQVYSQADLAQLALAGIDCITNPSPGGNYFSCFLGHNTSSDPLRCGDAYTRMTNFEITSFNTGLGKFVGQINNQTEQNNIVAAASAFLDAQFEDGLIGNSSNPGALPYSVTLPAAQNSQAQTALGYQFLLVEITYFSIVEKLVCTVQGGSSVVITQSQGVATVS